MTRQTTLWHSSRAAKEGNRVEDGQFFYSFPENETTPTLQVNSIVVSILSPLWPPPKTQCMFGGLLSSVMMESADKRHPVVSLIFQANMRGVEVSFIKVHESCAFITRHLGTTAFQTL